MHLRKARISDSKLLRYWDKQPHIIASKGEEDWNWEIELPRKVVWREQFIAELDGKAIGFVQIIDPKSEETHYWGDVPEGFRAIDIWIGELNYIGKGYGYKMMQLAIERCFEKPDVKAILVDPLQENAAAQRFYEKLGFKFYENRRLGDDFCAVFKLTRVSKAFKTT